MGVFIERPNIIRELDQSEDQLRRIVMMRDYRSGKYIQHTAREITDMMMGQTSE
jgi:hypothetical protein